VEIRLQEATAEAELALRFLEEGLHRNAAGKAFQAWKAALAAAAALARDEMLKRYGGKVATREGAEVELADWLISLMPTGKMWGWPASCGRYMATWSSSSQLSPSTYTRFSTMA
jgi:Archaeal PaREP1/PaREP8 family.